VNCSPSLDHLAGLFPAVGRFRPAAQHYRSRRPERAPLGKRIREIAETRVRYGYRRIHVLLRLERWQVSVKRVRRFIVQNASKCDSNQLVGASWPNFAMTAATPPERTKSGR
jgi:transposase InsO family protein